PPAAGMRGWFARGRQPAQAERPQETPAAQPGKQPGRDKRHAAHLDLLKEVASSLSSVLDQPVAAQLVVNAVQRAFDAARTFILVYDTERRDFALQAIAGKNDFLLPPSCRLSSQKGLPGKAYRLGASLLVNDTRQDADYLELTEHPCLSELVVPFVQRNRVKGVLVLDEFHTDAFDSADISVLESVSEQLLNAWERANYHQRLTDLIQSGITLSTILDPQTAIQQVAEIAQKALAARFVFVTLLDQEGSLARIASAGAAPGILRSLKKTPEKNPLIKATLNAKQIMRLRDVRKSGYAAHVRIEQAACRNMISFPIRLHQLSVGAVLAFGKIGEPSFSESDESLAELMASLSAASIENTWLYQELRSTLNNATLLHQMGIRILQADSLRSAAETIAQTAFRLGHASVAGIVLFQSGQNSGGGIEARIEVDEGGVEEGNQHPESMIRQAIETGQAIIISDDRFASKVCIPLRTAHRTSGALWLDIPEGRWYNSRYAASLQTLAQQATVALERMILLSETRDQASRLEAAYGELEITYDQTLAALMSALDARDRETEGHSSRVGAIAACLGKEMGLSSAQAKAMERGALLHDIGKIGISDSILLKTGSLDEHEWGAMRQHPTIGTRIVTGIPFLEESLPIIRCHHERWNGSGYPDGLTGEQIPLQARIFAVADAFDALLSNRPYRRGVPTGDVLAYLREQSGILFDPAVIKVLEKLFSEGKFADLVRA
ncbi:MAG: hypothetical protein FD146_2546, partial [Anaerolineaceae bacterium]